MKWEPWETHKDATPGLSDIAAPPCPHCKHWRPQAKFFETPYGMFCDGVRCCHAEDQQQDFSCYRAKGGEA